MPLDIDRVHLTTILCNLLDNALEACSKLPADKRNMYLTLTFDSNLLSITVKMPMIQKISTFKMGSPILRKLIRRVLKRPLRSSMVRLNTIRKTVMKNPVLLPRRCSIYDRLKTHSPLKWPNSQFFPACLLSVVSH